MVKLHGQHVHPLFIAVPVFIGSCGYESIPINTIYSGMNIHELAAIECCSPGFWHVLTHIHTSIHPYTSIYIPYIYILYISHFCCEHPISAVWIHRLTTACWGEHRLDGVEDALDQWLGVLNPWGQITWRENRLWGSGLCGGQKLHGDWLKSLKVGPMSNFWAHFFLEKSASIGRFLIFFSEMKISKWVETKNLGCRVETS